MALLSPLTLGVQDVLITPPELVSIQDPKQRELRFIRRRVGRAVSRRMLGDTVLEYVCELPVTGQRIVAPAAFVKPVSSTAANADARS